MKAESTRPIEYVDLDGSVIKHLSLLYLFRRKGKVSSTLKNSIKYTNSLQTEAPSLRNRAQEIYR